MKNNYRRYLYNKNILITGGTGSFGTTVVKTLLSFRPKQIIIFSRDEKKQFDMRNQYPDKRLEFIIGDVRDKDSVERAIKGVDFIFHAAALKQVPTCEFFPLEALNTNVLGTYNVIQTAINNKVKRVVFLSTDKAVYPINTMGVTKALAEKIVMAESRQKKDGNTILCCVRYGNVMYSRGSVIPLFVELMKQGKPLTITNKDMTRFLLPLKQAIDLVLYTLIKGESGSIFVRKAPACTIGVLAQAMCQLFKYNGGIQEIGIRPGEKMHETLISTEELLRAEDHGNYYRIIPEFNKLDYEKYFIKGQKYKTIFQEGYTSANTKQLSMNGIIKLLKSLNEIQEELKNFRYLKLPKKIWPMPTWQPKQKNNHIVTKKGIAPIILTTNRKNINFLQNQTR